MRVKLILVRWYVAVDVVNHALVCLGLWERSILFRCQQILSHVEVLHPSLFQIKWAHREEVIIEHRHFLFFVAFFDGILVVQRHGAVEIWIVPLCLEGLQSESVFSLQSLVILHMSCSSRCTTEVYISGLPKAILLRSPEGFPLLWTHVVLGVVLTFQGLDDFVEYVFFG